MDEEFVDMLQEALDMDDEERLDYFNDAINRFVAALRDEGDYNDDEVVDTLSMVFSFFACIENEIVVPVVELIKDALQIQMSYEEVCEILQKDNDESCRKIIYELADALSPEGRHALATMGTIICAADGSFTPEEKRVVYHFYTIED